MADTTFLHIRRRDSSPTQVMELAESSVRIGRGPDCEVRLGGDDLAEIHCLLRRSGEDWRVEPSAEVLIDGRPVLGARELAPGEVLRIGDHWLSIQSGDSTPSSRGSFETPIVVSSVELSEPAGDSHRTVVDSTASPADLGSGEERLARWQASQEQRERWLRDRKMEEGWEARWRAAGDALRGRSSAASSPPKSATPYRRPETEPSAQSRSRPAHRPAAPPAKQSFSEGPTSIFALPGSKTDAPSTIPFARPSQPVLKLVEAPDSPAIEADLADRLDPAQSPEALIEDRGDEPETNSERLAEPIEAGSVLEAPEPVAFEPIAESREPIVESETNFREPPRSPGPGARLEDPGWPSVQSILASRAIREKASGAQPVRSGKETPTEARSPARWKIPGWLALPIGIITFLTAGGGGSALALTWAWEARTTSPIADRVLKGGDLPASGELPEVATLGASWWRSTSGNLYLMAIAADRSEIDPDREDRVRFFLQAARLASPLRPDVRLALARLPRRDGESRPSSDSGFSRDVVSLAWTGHERLASGRFAEAKDAYFASLDMACRSEPPDLAPALDGEQEGRRFRISGEDALEPVLTDMADGPDWNFGQWSSALPSTALVRLAAYRVLKARESPDAIRALDSAATAPEPPAGYPRAFHLAAKAEALAIQGRWADAGPLYEEAIACRAPGTIRRSWYANLADLEGRLGQESRRRDAWELAISGASAGDEVGRLVARARGRAGLGARTDANVSKASFSSEVRGPR